TAYFSNNGAGYIAGTVTPIATATNIAGPPITVGIAPIFIAITPDGKTAYVANAGAGTVTPTATATNPAGPPITGGFRPNMIAITPDGKTAYVANVEVIGSGTGIPLATSTNTHEPPLPVRR